MKKSNKNLYNKWFKEILYINSIRLVMFNKIKKLIYEII